MKDRGTSLLLGDELMLDINYQFYQVGHSRAREHPNETSRWASTARPILDDEKNLTCESEVERKETRTEK